MVPPSDENENCVVDLKEQSILKNAENRVEIDNKRQRNACSNYAAIERTVLRIRSVTNKKKLETRNRSITSKAMQYRQDIATRTCITRMELITISIVTIGSIWHKSAADFWRF